MATKRPSLADVSTDKRGPGRARLQQVDRRSERVRQQRFRPDRDLVDFRHLSATINQGIEAAGELNRVNEIDALNIQTESFLNGREAQVEGELNLPAESPMPSTEGPPQFFTPAEYDEAGKALRNFSPVPPLLHPKPDTRTDARKFLDERMQAAQRAGLPITANPLVTQANSTAEGRAIAIEADRRMRAGIGMMSEWDMKRHGPRLTVSALSRQVWKDLKEQYPGMRRNAKRALLLGIGESIRDIKGVVQPRLNKSFLDKTINQTILPTAKKMIAHAIDPTIGARQIDTTKKGQEAYLENAAASISEFFDDYERRGVFAVPGAPSIRQVRLDAMAGAVKQIMRDNKGQPFALKAQLEDALEVMDKVKFESIRAEQDEGYQTQIADQVNKEIERIDRGTNASVGGTLGTAIVGIAGDEVAELLRAGTDGDAANDADAQDKFRIDAEQRMNEHAEEKGITGSDLTKFQINSRAMIERQIGQLGEQTKRQGQSVLDNLRRDLALGSKTNSEFLEELKSELAQGRIHIDQYRQGQAMAEQAQKTAVYRRPGSVYAIAKQQAGNLETQFLNMKLSPGVVQPLQRDFNDRMQMFTELHQAEAERLMGEGVSDAEVRVGMQNWMSSFGQSMFDEAQRPLREFVERSEEKSAQVRQWSTQNRRVTDEEWATMRDTVGLAELEKLRRENANATNPSMLFNRLSAEQNQLRQTLSLSLQEIPEVKQAASQLLDPREQKEYVKTLMGRFGLQLDQHAMAVIREQTTNGATDMGKAFTEAMQERVNLVSQAAKQYLQEDIKEFNRKQEATGAEAYHSAMRLDPSPEKKAGGYLQLFPEQIRGNQTQRFLQEYFSTRVTPRSVGRFAPPSKRDNAALALFQDFQARVGKIRGLKTLSGGQKNQLVYDMQAAAGHVTIKDIEAGSVRDVYGYGKSIPIDKLNIRSSFTPLFKNEKELRDFVNNAERFRAVAERLGFSGIDEGVEDLSTIPSIRRWAETQKDALRLHGRN